MPFLNLPLVNMGWPQLTSPLLFTSWKGRNFENILALFSTLFFGLCTIVARLLKVRAKRKDIFLPSFDAIISHMATSKPCVDSFYVKKLLIT